MTVDHANPHAGQPVSALGAPLGTAPTVVILIHGRNAGPGNILELVQLIDRTDVTYLAPAAAGRTWYPNPFIADVSTNEPWLSSALAAIGTLVSHVEAAGVDRARIVLGGFSQGACLAAEFAIQNASRFGGVVVLSGGAIGAPGTTWNWPG